MDSWILSLLIFLPVIGALIMCGVSVSNFKDDKDTYKFIALGTTGAQLVLAIIFGFYLFNEVPTIYTLSGAGLIVISSAIIFIREHQLKKPITLPRQ